MTLGRWAYLCSLAAAMLLADESRAGIWGIQPTFGILGDYYTNPGLIQGTHTAESHGDLLLDAPATYQGDAYKLTVLPSFRESDDQGYSSLDSNYEHLNVINQFSAERSTVTLTTMAARDSSLYHDYLLDGSTGVRRDSLLADLNADRQLTERLDLDTEVNWTRALYAESGGTATLTNYKYASLAPTLGWAASERSKLTAEANVGRYDSLDGRTQSTSYGLEFGWLAKVSEIWTIGANAGYSRAQNRATYTEYVLEIVGGNLNFVPVPFVVRSTQNGGVYTFTVTRQTALLALSASAAQELTPTGFAFLSREKDYQLKAIYTATERLNLSGDVHRLSYQQPAIGTTEALDLDITYVDASVAWQWTEHWTATFIATRVMEHYVSPRLQILSSGFSIELSRQFDWKSIR